MQASAGSPEKAAAFPPAGSVRIDIRQAGPQAQAGGAAAGASSSLTAGGLGFSARASTAAAGGASAGAVMEGGDKALSPLSLNPGTASPVRKGPSPASSAKVVAAAKPGRSVASMQLPASNTSAAGTEVAVQAGLWEAATSRQHAEGRQGTQSALDPQAGMPQQAVDGRQDMQPENGLAVPRCAGGSVALSSRPSASPKAGSSFTLGSRLEASPSAGVTVAGGSVAVGGSRSASPGTGASMALSSRLSASPRSDTPPMADLAAASAGSVPIPMTISSVRCGSCALPNTVTQAVLHHAEAAGASVRLHLPGEGLHPYMRWKLHW